MGLKKSLFFRRGWGRRVAALIVAAPLTGCAPVALREVSKETIRSIIVMQVAGPGYLHR